MSPSDTPHSVAHTKPSASAYDLGYAELLGRLVANLTVLEIALRIALYLQETPLDKQLPDSFRMANLNVGDEMDESWLCNWAPLSAALNAYNKLQVANGKLPIDDGIIDLRNALAHGRIIAEAQGAPMALIRFERAQAGKVRVTEKHVMSLEWLRAQSARVYAAAASVHNRMWELRI
jgi:hypothetical protein